MINFSIVHQISSSNLLRRHPNKATAVIFWVSILQGLFFVVINQQSPCPIKSGNETRPNFIGAVMMDSEQF